MAQLAADNLIEYLTSGRAHAGEPLRCCALTPVGTPFEVSAGTPAPSGRRVAIFDDCRSDERRRALNGFLAPAAPLWLAVVLLVRCRCAARGWSCPSAGRAPADVDSTPRPPARPLMARQGGLDAMASARAGLHPDGVRAVRGLRQAVDERLALAVAESRNGRAPSCWRRSQPSRASSSSGWRISMLRHAAAERAGGAGAAAARRDGCGAGAQEWGLPARAPTSTARLGHVGRAQGPARSQQLAASPAVRRAAGWFAAAVQRAAAGPEPADGRAGAGSQANAEQLRTALNERLAIQADNNTAKLEEMRRTVDENPCH